MLTVSDHLPVRQFNYPTLRSHIVDIITVVKPK